MRIVCSGGGTGGHIFPAVAVAQEIKKRNPEAEVLFIGARGKMEMTKVPKAGFPIKGLWISGLQRKLTFRNVLFPIKLIWSIVHAYFILKKFRPHVVAGFGGYASGAALWVAVKMSIPTLIQEQNSFPGMTNKILNGSVDVVCVAFEESKKYFDKSLVVVTGNPVREGLDANMDVTESRTQMGLDADKRTVLIVGGSLGAKSINEAIDKGFTKIQKLTNIQFIWQCGTGYFNQFKEGKTARLEHVHLMPFIEEMSKAYSAADLVVCRAGALTIAEMMYLGKAAILIPSPNVAEDHQTKNALSLVKHEAAILLRDSDLDKLIDQIEALLKDEARLTSLRQNIIKLAQPGAVADIVNEIDRLAKKRVK